MDCRLTADGHRHRSGFPICSIGLIIFISLTARVGIECATILGLDLDKTVGVVQYLTYPSEKPIEVEGRLINPMEMKNKILSELKMIESKCADVGKNKPLPIGQFSRTEELGYCKMCKYREICRPDYEKQSTQSSLF